MEEWRDVVLTSAAGDSNLHVQLPTNFKQIRAIKLMSYSISTKVGTVPSNELYALHVKQMPACGTHTNAGFMEGALYVIHTCVRSTLTDVAHNDDPHGLACASFSPVNFPALTVTLTNKDGERPLTQGDIHVWVRLLGTFG